MISVVCQCCCTHFSICQSCWRGQAYCSDACRLSARRASHRKAQQRYRQTEKGKRAHRLAENRRRHAQRADQKNMDDPSSTPPLTVYKMAPKSKTKVSLSCNDKFRGHEPNSASRGQALTPFKGCQRRIYDFNGSKLRGRKRTYAGGF